MTLLSSLILSLAVAVVSAGVPWAAIRVNRLTLLIALGLGVALSILIAAFSLVLYPWTNLVVLLVGLSAGILLGRLLPARTGPFLVLLLVLSALDITQIVLSSHGSSHTTPATIPPPGQLIGNLFLALPWGRFNIGVFDVFIIAAMSEHWRKRRYRWALGQLPGIIGVILAFAFLQFVYRSALPLIPFLTVGWLCSLALAPMIGKRILPQGQTADEKQTPTSISA